VGRFSLVDALSFTIGADAPSSLKATQGVFTSVIVSFEGRWYRCDVERHP
jgi:hypothetical protein